MKKNNMKIDENITAMILAAGRGRRLGELTLDKPKCMLPVGGFPIIYHQLKALEKTGVLDVTIVTGFMKEDVEKYALQNFPSLNFNFVHNLFFTTTNTLYSLALAAEVVGGSKPILQLNGDIFFDHNIIERILSADISKSHIATQIKKCGEEEIKIVLAPSGAAAFLNKRVLPDEAIGEAVGINKFTPKFWKALAANLKLMKDNFSHEYFEYAVEKTIAGKHTIYPFDIENLYAIEIDFPGDLTAAEAIFKHVGAQYAKIS